MKWIASILIVATFAFVAAGAVLAQDPEPGAGTSTNDNNKIVEIKLDIPRNPLFAKKQSKTFEEATDIAIDALRRQITKQKGKQRGI